MRKHAADYNFRDFATGGTAIFRGGMAVWQRDLPQEWEVRPAPAKGCGKWRKKRRTSQQGGALGEGGEGTSAQTRRIAPEGPIFFKENLGGN